VTTSKVFLSYAHADSDKTFVRNLYERLKRDGIQCFFDEESLSPGVNFVLKISEAIDECNYLVMVMSQAYFSGNFAPAEWTALFGDDPKNERGRLVPLLFEQCELPSLIKPLNYIDVSSQEKINQNYHRIIQLLSRQAPNDIEERLREINDLLDQDKSEQLIKRLLDFARDFAKERRVVNRLTAIKLELERTKAEGAAAAMARIDLWEEGLNLKDGVVESLSLESNP
jgi:hypothetical protein